MSKSLGEKLFDAMLGVAGETALWAGIGANEQAQTERIALLSERDSLLAAKEADGRQKRAYLDEIDRLKDTVEGLTCDLRLAVETAYHRGATDWTRMNYPRIYAALTTKEG